MKRIPLILSLALGFSGAGFADELATSLDLYHSLPKATAGAGVSRDSAELKAAQSWLATDVAPPIAGAQGEVIYAYGHSHPQVLCAPLNLCIVGLIPGEKIINLSIGDSVRWITQPSQAGDRPVIVIKPTVEGLRTNLVVTTDTGHIYYLNLVSDKTDFVPMISFYDPEKLIMKLNDQKAADQEKTRKDGETHVVTLPNINPENLNFEYWWEGPKAYQPVRVFSAEGKVMIQMPADMKYGDAPALFILEKDQEQLTNYRLSGSYFVVDRLFTEARLVLGVGNDRTTVTIHAGRKPLWAGFFGN